MAGLTVSVQGLREVTRSLSQYAGAIDELKEANAKIGSKVAQTAIATAPKLSGALASSVKYNRAKNSVSLKAGGARVPYAGVIEYGDPNRGIEAQPFLRRAAWNDREYIKQQFSANLEGLKRQYLSN